MKKNSLIYIALAVAFFIYGISVVSKSMPEQKDQKVYKQLQPYFSYTIEKRFGGLQIHFKDTEEVMKPSNAEFFEKIESIDRDWAKRHLELQNNNLKIFDENNNTIKEIQLDAKAKDFVITYFDLEQK